MAIRIIVWSVCALGVATWLALGAASMPGWFPGWGAWVRSLPPALLALPGLCVAGPLVFIRPALVEDKRPSVLPPARAFILTSSILALLVLMIAAAQSGKPPVSCGLVVVLGTITIAVAAYALEAIRSEEGVSFDSTWGGLGGGLGGWRLSTAATFLLLLLVFSSATVAVAVIDPDKLVAPSAPADKKGPVKDQGGPADGKEKKAGGS